MKLLYSPTSPFSSKVRMAAHYLALDITSERVKTDPAPAVLTENNPLGKIPVLLREDALPVYDSVAIMQFLNRTAKGGLYPRNAEKRTEAEVLEALCDGITDCLIAIVYERRYHPSEKVHEPWIEMQWTKVTRGLDYLEANLPRTTKSLHGGHFALAALLAYLDLRFEGQWQRGRPKLKKWPARFARYFEAHDALRPQA